MTSSFVALLAVPREGASGGTVFLVQMVIIFAIFYLLLLRPQAKERQRHERMLQAIKKGDEIITNGGIIGTVVHAEESRLTVRTAENTRLTVDRTRIATVVNPQPADESTKGDKGAKGAKGDK